MRSGCPWHYREGAWPGFERTLTELAAGQGGWYTYDDAGSIPGSSRDIKSLGDKKVRKAEESTSFRGEEKRGAIRAKLSK
jgi:hypothetical protein